MNQAKMKKWPWFGTVGFLLMTVFWYLNWNLEGVRTHWAFFPMWLGFILWINGISFFLKGSCLVTRSLPHFIFLFALSSPFWWIFEFFNERVEYWIYIPSGWLSRIEYIFFASLNFSVVLPGIFSLAEVFKAIFSASRFNKVFEKYWIVGDSRMTVVVIFVLGWGMLALTLLYPQYSMAFLWISLFFIIDPINYWLGYPSILEKTAKGNWSLIWILWCASLTCGFFWEMWNYYSYPKWLYDIPYVGFLYIFEMPILGYLGYLPFSMELFAMYSFIVGLLGWSNVFEEVLK